MSRGLAAAAALFGLAGLSALLPAAPSYDAWAYLAWGREVAHLELHTVDGPAFKPLPVAVCALLAPLGEAAPTAWLVLVRAGALAAILAAGVMAAALAPARRMRVVAGVGAALGVAITGSFLDHAAVGNAEPLVVAFALLAWQRHRAGAPMQALLLGALAGLVRVEVWPFLAAYAAVLAWRELGVGAVRAALPRIHLVSAALLVALPVAWLLPELAGSGQLLRSGDRALVPNPGAPALAARPFLASLEAALALLPLPLAAAALAAPRGARLPALAGLAWCALVALMAELGFSGEPRYALPGVAVLAVSAAVGLARLRTVPALAIAALALTVGLSAPSLWKLPGRLDERSRLASDLPLAIERAGGRAALLACGRPAVGRYRGTLLAYALDVPKHQVRADGAADAVTFRSRLTLDAELSPPPAGRVLATTARWRIEARCVSQAGGRSVARAR